MSMAPEVTYNLSFELNDLNYPYNHCYRASNTTISRWWNMMEEYDL